MQKAAHFTAARRALLQLHNWPVDEIPKAGRSIGRSRAITGYRAYCQITRKPGRSRGTPSTLPSRVNVLLTKAAEQLQYRAARKKNGPTGCFIWATSTFGPWTVTIEVASPGSEDPRGTTKTLQATETTR